MLFLYCPFLCNKSEICNNYGVYSQYFPIQQMLCYLYKPIEFLTGFACVYTTTLEHHHYCVIFFQTWRQCKTTSI